MPFKSRTQPLCRCCGKPLKKWTQTRRFGNDFRFGTEDQANRGVFPKSKAEAQRYINDGTIVALKWHMKDGRPEGEQSISDRHENLVKDYIYDVSIWDGESYRDGFFCNNDHAMQYAYTMVQHPDMKLAMVAYLEAVKARESQP